MAPGALLAGEERLHDRGGPVVGAARARTAGRRAAHDHRGVPVSSTASSSAALHAGQPQDSHVAALAAGAAAEQSGAVAERQRHHVRARGGARRPRRCPRASESSMPVRAGVVTTRVGELRADRLEQRRQRRCRAALRMLPADVARGTSSSRAAAVRPVGVRADHRDALAAPAERQRAVVAQQHDRPLGDLAASAGSRPGRGRRPRSVRVSRSPASASGTGVQSGVEQAELDLLREHPRSGAVDQRLVDRGRPRPPRRSGSPKRLHRRQFDVDARGERERRPPRPRSAATPCSGREEARSPK